VTQQTAANAEESASAAEEMNAQAQQMRMFVEELAAVVGVNMEDSGSSGRGSVPSAAIGKPVLPPSTERKKKILVKHEKSTKKKPGDVIPFGKDEKESFKDF
jgi:methyl-accepting chemotaxis protein